MSVADANRFRELVTRMDALERAPPGLPGPDIPAAIAAGIEALERRMAALEGSSALTEVVAALQRRLGAVEKQQQETALFLTRKLGSNAAAR